MLLVAAHLLMTSVTLQSSHIGNAIAGRATLKAQDDKTKKTRKRRWQKKHRKSRKERKQVKLAAGHPLLQPAAGLLTVHVETSDTDAAVQDSDSTADSTEVSDTTASPLPPTATPSPLHRSRLPSATADSGASSSSGSEAQDELQLPAQGGNQVTSSAHQTSSQVLAGKQCAAELAPPATQSAVPSPATELALPGEQDLMCCSASARLATAMGCIRVCQGTVTTMSCLLDKSPTTSILQSGCFGLWTQM